LTNAISNASCYFDNVSVLDRLHFSTELLHEGPLSVTHSQKLYSVNYASATTSIMNCRPCWAISITRQSLQYVQNICFTIVTAVL